MILDDLYGLHTPRRVQVLPRYCQLSAEQTRRLVNKVLPKYDIVLRSDEWNWNWLASHSLRKVAYTGPLPKRLLKLYRVRKKEQPSSEFTAELEDVFAPQLAEAQDYYIDYTAEVDWAPGTFGDAKSLFFARRERSPQDHPFQWIAQVGGGFVRLYAAKPAGPGRGLARATMLPLTYTTAPTYYHVFPNNTAFALVNFTPEPENAYALGAGLHNLLDCQSFPVLLSLSSSGHARIPVNWRTPIPATLNSQNALLYIDWSINGNFAESHLTYQMNW
jgi:hypothetical protein